MPLLRSALASGVNVIEVPEVIAAADEVAAKIGKPGPHEKHANWDSIAHRLDETMRARLLEFGRQVI